MENDNQPLTKNDLNEAFANLAKDVLKPSFDSIEARLDAHDRKFESIEASVIAIDLDEAFANFAKDVLKPSFDSIEERFDLIDKRFDAVDHGFHDVNQEITKISEGLKINNEKLDRLTKTVKEDTLVIHEDIAKVNKRVDRLELKLAQI